MAIHLLTMFKCRCLNYIQFAALAFLVQIFLGGHCIIVDDISTETVPGDTSSSDCTDATNDGTGEVSSGFGGSEVLYTNNIGDICSSGGSSADFSGNDEWSNSAAWNIMTGGNKASSSPSEAGGWMNGIIESMIGIKTEQSSSGGSNGFNQNVNNIIGNIIGSLSGRMDSDDSIGTALGGIWDMITGNSDGSAEKNSAHDLDRIKNMRIQEMVSIIGRFIRNLPDETAAGLTDEDIETIIRNVIDSLDGGTSSIEVETIGDLLTVLQKSSLSTLLESIAEYLSKWKITVDNTKYGILDLVTMPQKELYKIIQHVIENFQTIVDSTAQSVLGENFLVNTILGFGNKTIECVVSSAVDLPGIVGDDLMECVTGRVNEVIQLVIDGVLEIRSSLLLLRHIVDSVTGCSGLFCLGAATATTMTDGINLVIKVVGTVAHIAFFSSTLVVELPGCFVGSVTLTPAEEVAKIIGRFGLCMIP